MIGILVISSDVYQFGNGFNLGTPGFGGNSAGSGSDGTRGIDANELRF